MTENPDRTARRALLLINTHARRGADAEPLVLAALEKAGIVVERGSCDRRDDIAATIRARADHVDCVVLGGGDGTLNAAAPALIETGLPFGVIPLGTANDLARTLGIPLDPTEAAAVVAEGCERRIDLGLANQQPFFNVASIGFGVDLTRALTRDAKRRWGPLGYAIAGFKVLSRMRPFRVHIEQGDQRSMSRTIHLAIGNGRHYGGGMTVSEDAAIDDGRLNVYSLEVRSALKLLFLLPAMRRGTHGRWKEVRTFSSAEIVVRTRKPRSVNTDGEITTRTPVHFQVLRHAVRVYVPRQGVVAAGREPVA
ncbi:lipid kinase [Lichenihabitans sp. Uapishka_5]|uniref:lipid kinase n=1 Tax=Lichenihabitans sp. Uapishka_5 TaxID=3037302 RepID=UPI0029E80CB0|nr:lipid kinase [Lichenihabitans sp. Uapishka_5]MDX7951151.1 lipid kinase [Lichenihabitans sp. Uapishka_5]